MQQLQKASIGVGTAAEQLLQVVPQVMQFIRLAAQRNRAQILNIHQFRTIAFVLRRPGASLSDIAEVLGVTLPATSRLVDSLVKKGYLDRRVFPADRRLIHLTVRPAGKTILDSAIAATRKHLVKHLSTLTSEQCERLALAMTDLAAVFPAGLEPDDAPV